MGTGPRVTADQVRDLSRLRRITVDRKILSDLAIREPAAFQAIVEKAKAALPKETAAAA